MTATPSPCVALLPTLGDSYESRRLINELAHDLSLRVKEVEDGGGPWSPSGIIDPFQRSLETWGRIVRCPAPAQPEAASGT